MSEEVRPREKLLESDNPKAVGTEELLAIVLGHGTKGKNVFDLSKEVKQYPINMKVQSRSRKDIINLGSHFEDLEDRAKVLRIVYEEFEREYASVI
jgi:hypothetical protein